ncbi:hypothetical protein CN918_29785 [Priestia megaterium]|nr:hypothetical protein CN918_29785 [Priestia megaterium]
MNYRYVGALAIIAVFYFQGSGSTAAMDSNLKAVHSQSQKESPSHAKWGRTAMVEVKKKYPHAEIYDYRHVGREVKGQTSVETFQLWIRENHQSSKVTVSIMFDSNSEVITNIKIYPSNS